MVTLPDRCGESWRVVATGVQHEDHDTESMDKKPTRMGTVGACLHEYRLAPRTYHGGVLTVGAAIPLYAPYTHPLPLVSATPMHPRVDEVLDAPSAALRTRSPAPSALRHIRRTMLRPHVVKAASMIPCVPQREHARAGLLPILCARGTWSTITKLLLGRATWRANHHVCGVCGLRPGPPMVEDLYPCDGQGESYSS